LRFVPGTYCSTGERSAENSAEQAEVKDARRQRDQADKHHNHPERPAPVRETPPDKSKACDGADGPARAGGQELRKTGLSKSHCILALRLMSRLRKPLANN
jgi:hypothetical protein